MARELNWLISTQVQWAVPVRHRGVPLRRPREVLASERGRVFTKKGVRARRGVRGTVADGLQPRARHVDAVSGARPRAVEGRAV